MSDKYHNKYRIESTRLQNWDYGSNAMYFVTICTQHRICYFGEIANEKMILSEIGKMANQYWNEIPNHFPFVKLDEFIVMPNHLHGIVAIDKNVDGCDGRDGNNGGDGYNGGDGNNGGDGYNVETPNLGVSTANRANPTNPTNPGHKRTIPASKKWKPGILGVIINQYKRTVTINARQIHADFAWQSRFYDHIIRNDESFRRIRKYIRQNPSKWKNDKFYDIP